MKVSAKMTYLGMETGTSQNGKPYTVIGLLQGFDSERIYVNDDIKQKVSQLKPMTQVECGLNIRITSDRTYMNIEYIDPVPAK